MFYKLVLALVPAMACYAQITTSYPMMIGVPPGGLGFACVLPVPFYGNPLTGIIAACQGGVWVDISGSGGGGTVTVVGAGSLTSTAIVTGGGAQALQTPSATTTLDTSGNVSTPGTISAGVGGSVSGAFTMTQGTAAAAPTSSVGFQAPTSVTTKFLMTLPAAPTTGYLLNTGTSDPSVITYVPTISVATGGTGLTSGTSGGVPCYTGSTTIASSAALAVNSYVVGGGAGACPATISAAFATQTDGATITWAIASAIVANAVVTLGGNRTLNITNPVNGGMYVLRVVQDGTGSRGLTLGTGCTWKVISGGAGAITPTTTAAAIDILAFTYDGTNCYATFGKNYN